MDSMASAGWSMCHSVAPNLHDNPIRHISGAFFTDSQPLEPLHPVLPHISTVNFLREILDTSRFAGSVTLEVIR